ncbi:MAG TPA: hypothetical protein VGD56_04520 [Gemmatirosa sp.]
MANARTSSPSSNPSRIGKTLGAILSAPRRGAVDDADDTAEATVGDVVSPGDRSASEPDAASATDARLSHDRVPMADPAADAASAVARAPDARGAVPAAPTATSTTPPGPTDGMPRDGARRDAAQDVEFGADLGGNARRKKRETFLIPEELADAMRNAIVHLSGPPLYYTLAEFGEHAIRSYISQLEREHNGGHPFPPRPRAVRQGRPLR